MEIQGGQESTDLKYRMVGRVCSVCAKAFECRFRGEHTSKTCSRSCRQVLRWGKKLSVRER